MTRVRFVTPTRAIPGVQNLRARVPMRLASCRESDCPTVEQGWTEVVVPGGGRSFKVGRLTAEEAEHSFGVGTTVRYHTPGDPCPRLHKVPNGLPPVYSVDGRTVTEDEWKERLGEGAYTVNYLRTRG